MAKEPQISKWSLTLLRIVLGFIFTYHGYLKLFAEGGFKQTVGFFTQIGIPLPLYSALIVALIEFAGGILLLIGLLTRWASLLLLVDMLVAFFKVHMNNGFLITSGGYEFVLILLAGLVLILSSGAGKLALGNKFFKGRHLM